MNGDPIMLFGKGLAGETDGNVIITVLQLREDQMSFGGRAMEFAVHANIERLPVLGVYENEIFLSKARSRLQQQYNDQTDLRHVLEYVLCSSDARSRRDYW